MGEIRQISALAEMFPNGQKTNAAIVEYDFRVCNAELSIDQFAVENRRILRAYTNHKPCLAQEGTDGCYVILELDIQTREADIVVDPPRKPGEKGPPPPKYRREPAVRVKQLLPVKGCDGAAAEEREEWMESTAAIEPVVSDFLSLKFEGLKYYLYIPKQYDCHEKYPLVLFMTDLGANGDDDKMALSQGNGGTVWATPEEQTKHPSFVLVPQFPFMQVMKDDFTFDPIYCKVKRLLDSVTGQYSIDMDRIYLTGQSQGCMAACQLNVEYPDFFAASMLVAGQWDPETMGETCAHHKYWILVSELDNRAHPGMDAVTEALERNGARVKKFAWDAKADKEQRKENVARALEEDANVRYTCFSGDSVLSPEDNGPNRLHHVHSATWPVAYDIEGVRDWLFSCRR